MPSRNSLSARPDLGARSRAAGASGVASAIASTLVAVRPASGRGRAELIRDVVDAYRRLYGSVQRFVLTLTGAPTGSASVGSAPSLNQLLSMLADQASAAAFARLRDLKTAIGEARSADQLRDSIFSDALSNDLAALRKVVGALERLDNVFIGLSVEHVLERNAQNAHITRDHAAALRQPATARANQPSRAREPNPSKVSANAKAKPARSTRATPRTAPALAVSGT